MSKTLLEGSSSSSSRKRLPAFSSSAGSKKMRLDEPDGPRALATGFMHDEWKCYGHW